jgi:hypothetical protein
MQILTIILAVGVGSVLVAITELYIINHVIPWLRMFRKHGPRRWL